MREMMDTNEPVEPTLIHEPIVRTVGGLIYQVTMPSGAVLTNPADFSDNQYSTYLGVNPYFAEDGRFLVAGE